MKTACPSVRCFLCAWGVDGEYQLAPLGEVLVRLLGGPCTSLLPPTARVGEVLARSHTHVQPPALCFSHSAYSRSKPEYVNEK